MNTPPSPSGYGRLVHLALFFLFAAVVLCSHDLYLKMETYFLEPGQSATLSLYNGTFEKSENLITRDRILDASVVHRGERAVIAPGRWEDLDSTITRLPFRTGEPGTYVVGVSTGARDITLAAEKFNDYLAHDGVKDMLDRRTQRGGLDQDAVERYEKHVKAIYQVGDARTDDWQTVLGYPIEFVPQANPYERHTGEELPVRLLLDGKPLAGQLVYADYLPAAHTHDHTLPTHGHGDGAHAHTTDDHQHAHTHTGGQQLRTDEAGLVTVVLPEDGNYYLRTIHMIETPEEEALTHRSKWATLTFGVSHRHGMDTHTHADHAHDHDHAIPTWIYLLGSLLLIAVLFLVFRTKAA